MQTPRESRKQDRGRCYMDKQGHESRLESNAGVGVAVGSLSTHTL